MLQPKSSSPPFARDSSTGPPRKYYRLTTAGEAQLATLDDYWTRINRTLAGLGRSMETPS
ncbi:MAG: PadR family transcriptional regulator [Proteobacteria bacterium]|nr:PadR family transcriptional regulator [Pseudomonadota bacterium]